MRMMRVASALAMLVAGFGTMGVGRAASSGTAPVIEKSGCCSHHKGVCGCEEGRAKCCDGTFSPSCGC